MSAAVWRASWWPGCWPRALILTPTRSSSSTSTRATGARCRSSAVPSTWPSAISYPWPPWARSCRTAWPSAGARCAASGPTACCARPTELGLPEDGDGGILLLPPGLAAPGTPLTEALALSEDVVYDLEISPNRPDALSVAGVARDLAAALGVPFSLPSVRVPIDATVERATIDVRGCRALSPLQRHGAVRRHRRRLPGLVGPPAHVVPGCGRSTTSSTSPTT